MTTDPFTRITLRIPKKLHGRLIQAGKGDSPSTSLNSEIVQRLEESFKTRPDPAELQARYDAAVADMRQKFDNAADTWLQTIRELQAQNKDLTERLIAALEAKK